MAIAAYPRTAIQGTPVTNNKQNGLSLMLYNSSTQEYEAATSATFAGGGGGGDATAANQTTQINEVISSNLFLDSIANSNTVIGVNTENTVTTLTDTISNGKSLADLFNMLKQINGGTNGSYYQNVDSGTVSGLSVEKIVINEDAVLTRLEDSATTDLLTLYNLAGKTLKQGTVIVTNGFRINVVRVGSGSILRYGL